ncbi:caspase-related protein [Amycolatopsis balhimycina DSM 5908]|uniref:Caspase-related protein n=1 Tax=Amycolatopsis balhimycina DSM 5908 TaxID=1081091 RepID=A0A428W1M7_AMYBA|nr:caspase-related protein [Amycolatopsis balhimycina DSM 5908]
MIVANGEYDNAGLQRLGSPAADADALAGVLADRTISDFDVRVVRNETAHVVEAEIEDLCAEGRPDDVLLLHFSCHGLKDDSGGLYFAARNTRPDRLRSTAVPADFVQQCIRQSRSRSIVLLLDCCYGGAFGQGVAVRSSGDANVLDSFRGGRGRAVITASNSIEYAFEGAKLASDEPAQPSVFTSALVEGLRTGEADRDEDGWIALGELYEYLFDRVRERNPKQTPSRDIEMQGELYLAKSGRRRIKPSPIPADLSAAIAAENPFTRLGAVAELRRRLASDNLPVALGAFEALKLMASTDIEHVAAAASDALGFAVVRVDAAALRLSAPAGSRASAPLRTLGPPVAREVRFEASHSWIRVTATDSGADLAATAGEPGTRRGNVVVTGPTGDVVVAVEIEALPVPEPVAAPEAEPVPAAEAGTAPIVVAGPEPGSAPPSEPVAKPAAAEEVPKRPNVALGALDAPNATLGRSTGPVVAGAERGPAPDPGPAAAGPGTRESAAGQVDPVGGFAGLLAVAGAVLALAGLPLTYRYGYSLGQYRPGMDVFVLVMAACALLAGILTLAPGTRSRTGPALLFGTGLAALFGLLRFLGEAIALSQHGDTELKAGYTFELLAHVAWLVAAVCALAALWRSPAVALGAGWVRGRPAWAAILLGVTAATGWVVQLGDLTTYDSSDGGRATVYFLLGALLAVSVPVVAVVLRPRAVGCAVLATGTAGLLGVLAPTFTACWEEASLSLTGQAIATVALVLLAADTVVLAVQARNQPIGRQP